MQLHSALSYVRPEDMMAACQHTTVVPRDLRVAMAFHVGWLLGTYSQMHEQGRTDLAGVLLGHISAAAKLLRFDIGDPQNLLPKATPKEFREFLADVRRTMYCWPEPTHFNR